MDKSKAMLSVYVLLFTIFLYSSIITLFIFSFNVRMGLPFEGPTLQWYEKLWQDIRIHDKFWISIKLALATTAITTLIGTAAGITLGRPGIRAKKLLFYIILGSMIIPAIVYAISCAVFFQIIGLEPSLFTALFVHVAYTIPFATIIIMATVDRNIPYYEMVAQSLGATRLQTFRKITLPILAPSIISAAVFSFVLSYDELLRTIYVVFPGTLPIRLYDIYIIGEANPELFAISAFTTMLTLGLLFGAFTLIVLRGSVKLISRRESPSI